MDDKKKKQYAIFVSISLIIIGVIYFLPSPKNKGKLPMPVVQATPVSQTTLVQNDKPKSEPENGSLNEVTINSSTEIASGKRIVIRDIFKSMFSEREQIKPQEVLPVEIIEVKKEIRVIGILLAGDIKSCTLSDGRILKENESFDDYRVLKIKRGEVTFVSQKDGEVQNVKVWEDKK